MELIFKLPANKPPFLGIMYVNAYGAAKDNKNLVEEKRTGFEIRLIPVAHNIHVRIKSKEEGSVFWYKDLRYNKSKLATWMSYATGPINFGHVMRELDKDVLVKTLSKKMPFVLKIDRVYIEQEY
jgi:hypothetical protein